MIPTQIGSTSAPPVDCADAVGELPQLDRHDAAGERARNAVRRRKDRARSELADPNSHAPTSAPRPSAMK